MMDTVFMLGPEDEDVSADGTSGRASLSPSGNQAYRDTSVEADAQSGNGWVTCPAASIGSRATQRECSGAVSSVAAIAR